MHTHATNSKAWKATWSKMLTRNISTQNIATLLCTTCCNCLVTLLRYVAVCWMEQTGLVRMLRRNNVAWTWPNEYNIMQNPKMLRDVGRKIWPFSNLVQHHPICFNMLQQRLQHAGRNNVGICCVEMLRAFGRALMYQVLSEKSDWRCS